MKGYRTIGRMELNMLFEAMNPIYGQRKWQNRPECGLNKDYPYGVVCFFSEPIAIKDKEHKFEIVVDLKSPIEGLGDYDVSHKFQKSKVIFLGKGKQEILLKELYVRSYTIEDVVAINLKNYFALHYSDFIEDICKKYGIEFHNTNKYSFNLSGQ